MKTKLSSVIALALLAALLAAPVTRADGPVTGGILGNDGAYDAHVRTLTSGPDIDVDPLSLSATLCPDGTETQALAVCNLGDAELTWSASGTAEWLTVSPVAGTLGPGLCEQVTVTFDAAGLQPGSFGDAFSIDSNDPDEPHVTVLADLTVSGVTAFEVSWTPTDPHVGEQVLFIAYVQGGGAIDYAWDYGDGSPGGSGSGVIHAYATPGDFLVTLTLTWLCGSTQAQFPITVTALPGPDIDLYPTFLTGTVCEAGSDWQTLQVCNLGGADLTWSAAEEMEWLTVSPAEGTVAPGGCASVDVLFSGPGSYPFYGTIAFTSNDPYDPTVEVPANLVVLDSPHDAGFSWEPEEPVVGQEITFLGWAQGSTPLELAWDWGDGTPAGSGTVATHAYAAPGSYPVTLTASNGCDSTQVQHTVTVAGQQTMHVASIKMSYQYDEPGVRRVLAAVKIIDQAGQPVSGATVNVEWTLPNGQLRPQQRTTSPAGAARFVWGVTRLGTYQVCILAVTKSGMAYDPDQNAETCDSLTVPIVTR